MNADSSEAPSSSETKNKYHKKMLLMLAKRYLKILSTEGREAANEFEINHLGKDPELGKQLIPVIHNLMTNKNG